MPASSCRSAAGVARRVLSSAPVASSSRISSIPRTAARATASRSFSSRQPARLPATSKPAAPALHRRSFFSLPDISKLVGLPDNSQPGDGKFAGSSKVETDGEQQRFHARKILPYSPKQLYSLVSDVPSYSSFIPFCTSSEVLGPARPNAGSSPSHSRSRTSPSSTGGVSQWKPDNQPFDVEAELKVGFGGLEERYVSVVEGRPFESVTAVAAEESKLFKALMTKCELQYCSKTWYKDGSFSPASPLSPHASAAPPPAESQVSHKPNTNEPSAPTGPTLLTIDLAFTFANPMHRIASQAVLPMVADKMIEAFEKRCLEVYGPGKA